MKTAKGLNFNFHFHYLYWRQSFLALKLKFVKGHGYDTYESKKKKKEHKDDSVVFTETVDDEE